METKKALNTGYWTGYCLKVSTGVCRGGFEPADTWCNGGAAIIRGGEQETILWQDLKTACYYLGLK